VSSVHGLGSSHAALSGAWSQLSVVSLQESMVQATASAQLGGVPASQVEVPRLQVSAPLHHRPSSHCGSSTARDGRDEEDRQLRPLSLRGRLARGALLTVNRVRPDDPAAVGSRSARPGLEAGRDIDGRGVFTVPNGTEATVAP